MKRLIVALVLLVLILGLSFYSLYDMNQGITQLTDMVLSLRQTAPGQPEQLAAQSRQLLDAWNENEDHFVMYINHSTLDHITQIVAELPALAEYEDYGIFYSRTDSLLALLDDLWDAALPSYRNLA